MPEKADTMEVTGLNNYAPPLYSAKIHSVINRYAFWSTGENRRRRGGLHARPHGCMDPVSRAGINPLAQTGVATW